MICFNNSKFLEISNDLVTNVFGFNAWEILGTYIYTCKLYPGWMRDFLYKSFHGILQLDTGSLGFTLGLEGVCCKYSGFYKSPLSFLSCQLTNQFVELFSMFWFWFLPLACFGFEYVSFRTLWITYLFWYLFSYFLVLLSVTTCCLNQCWSAIVFFWYHPVSIMRIPHFLIPVEYGCFSSFCWCHSCLKTLQEPWYLGKIALVSIWFRLVLTQIITRGYKDSLTLTYPPISIFDWNYNSDTHG